MFLKTYERGLHALKQNQINKFPLSILEVYFEVSIHLKLFYSDNTEVSVPFVCDGKIMTIKIFPDCVELERNSVATKM